MFSISIPPVQMTERPTSLVQRGGKSRNRNSHQHGDDGHDDQHFHQGEALGILDLVHSILFSLLFEEIVLFYVFTGPG